MTQLSPVLSDVSASPQNAGFLFLCKPERRELYQAVLDNVNHKFEILDTPHELLLRCIAQPPQAVLVDVPTQIAMRSDVLDLIFDQNEKWPVLRCTFDQDSVPRAMSLTAMANEQLFVAMDSIAAGDAAWMDGITDRSPLTIQTQMRVRYRLGTEGGVWSRSNTLRLSAQGAFVVSYQEVEVGGRAQVRFLDLAPHHVGVNATLIDWKSWDDSPNLPGFRMRIDPDAQFAHAIEEFARLNLRTLLQANAIQ